MTTHERARAYLAQCPPAVSGASGHSTTFTVATSLVHGFNLDEQSALSLLREYNTRCLPPWSDKELTHKVRQAYLTAHDKPAGFLLTSGATTPSRQASVSPSGKFVPLRAAPVQVESTFLRGRAATRAFLEKSFQPDEVVCICLDGYHEPEHDKWIPASHGTFLPAKKWIAQLEDDSIWQQPGGVWIRINPTLPDNYVGSDKNVSSFRHVLIEFDTRPKAEQLEIITKCQLPVTAVIDSGGKSLHAWVRVDASDAQEWQQRRDEIYAYLEDCAPDPKNKNPSRFSRLPGAMRGDTEQSLIALNIGQPTWQQWQDWREQSELQEPTRPLDLLNFDTESDPNSLLGKRWLCKGGSLTIVGQSGVGKSSFAMQFGLTLALGKPFFGIKPVKPMRVAFIQAENDKGDMAEALQGVVAGLHLSQEHLELLNENVRFHDEAVKTGEPFIKLARSIIARHKANIIIADPLLAYAGDDISEQKFMSTFLRNQLNPVLHETGVLWVWLHHMPKPPKEKSPTGTVSDLAYAGAGSADLTNWSREVAVLKREGNAPIFTFTLTKRGKRAGMIDLMGNQATQIRIRHADHGICWEYVPPGAFTPSRGGNPNPHRV